MSKVSSNFENISYLISPEEFESIKEFVLTKGDRQTYRNFDNNNPHYKFEDFDIFFNAEIGQRNINNDPKISDFHEMVIADWEADIRYYHLVIVRENSQNIFQKGVYPGMQTGNVYLLDVYQEGLENLKIKLPDFLQEIKTMVQNPK